MVVTRGNAYQFDAHGESHYRKNALTKAGRPAKDLHREKVSPGEREPNGGIYHIEREFEPYQWRRRKNSEINIAHIGNVMDSRLWDIYPIRRQCWTFGKSEII